MNVETVGLNLLNLLINSAIKGNVLLEEKCNKCRPKCQFERWRDGSS